MVKRIRRNNYTILKSTTIKNHYPYQTDQIDLIPIPSTIFLPLTSQNLTMHFQTPLLVAVLTILKSASAVLTTESAGFIFVPMGTSIPTAITDASQLSAAISRISAYQTSLTAQSQYNSIGSVIGSAINANEAAGAPTTTIFKPATTYYGVPTTATWFSALPSDVKGYLQSVASMESKLATGNGAVPTGIGKVAGMGLALAGGLGAALML
jgi:hypothetical protein